MQSEVFSSLFLIAPILYASLLVSLLVTCSNHRESDFFAYTIIKSCFFVCILVSLSLAAIGVSVNATVTNHMHLL